MGRSVIVHENFLRRVAAGDLPEGRAPAGPLSREGAVSLYRSGCLSRHLDRTSRAMQAAGKGFYTIGSSGMSCIRRSRSTSFSAAPTTAAALPVSA